MASIFDELVLRLGIDPTGLNKGQKDALAAFKKMQDDAEANAKRLEAAGKRAGEGYFGEIKKQALELFAVLVGAGSLDKFITSTVGNLRQLQNAAQAVNLDPHRLAAFSAVIEAMGGDAKTARQEMTDLARVMAGWQSGTAIPGVDFLRAMSLIHAGRGDSPEEIFRKFSIYASGGYGKPTVAPSLVARSLGFGQDAETVEAMKGQRAVLDDLAKAYARTPTDEDIRRANELGRSFRELQQALSKDATELLTQVSPALVDFLNITDKIVTQNPELVKALIAIGTALTFIAGIKFTAGTLALLGTIGRGGAVVGGAAVAGGEVAGAASVGGLAAPALLIGGAGLVALTANQKTQLAALRKKLAHDQDMERRYGSTSPQWAADVADDQREIARLVGAATARANIVGPAGVPFASPSGFNGSISDRNNNPGNLTDGRGHFRRFATLQEGFAAMARQILIDYRRGQTTIRSLINDPAHGWSNQWAAGNSAASTANYIASVAKALHMSPDARLDLSNSATLVGLMNAMRAVERGSGGRSGGARISIGTINVNAPQAKDANGVARAIGGALASQLPVQANTGLTG